MDDKLWVHFKEIAHSQTHVHPYQHLPIVTGSSIYLEYYYS